MPKTYTRTLTLPNGKRKYFRGSTKKEAERKRDEVKAQLEHGVSVDDATTVAELAELWFNAYKKDQLHIRSEETIKGTLRRYVLPALGSYAVNAVKPLHVQLMMASNSKYSKSTQKKILQATKAIFQMAEENGLIVRSPVVSSIKAGGADPEEEVPLTYEQSDALLTATKGTRAYPLVLVLLYAGLRIGEALGLMWQDIDFNEGTLSVKRSLVYPERNRQGEINQEMKTSSARRTIPLPWFVVEELRAERKHSHSVYVFSMQNGSYLSYASFRALWRLIDYRTVTEVKGKQLVSRSLDFTVHPHQLRHTCVTRWFESGLDIKEIQKLAGHANVEITLRVYTHYQENLRGAETAQKIRDAVHTPGCCNSGATELVKTVAK